MKPRLSRRTMLRGFGLGGIAIGLPVLEAMLDDNGNALRPAGAQTIRQPNLAVIFVPNGINVDTFWPKTEGAGYALSRCLQPLAAFQNDFLVIQNLYKAEADRNIEIDNDAHSKGHASFMTGGGVQPNGLVEFASLDHVAADALGATTPFKVLATAMGGSVGGPSYANNISWKSPSAAEPSERDPVALFRKLFSSAGTGATPLVDYHKSVFDYVLTDLDRLKTQVGATDVARMDEHATSIRELEKQLAGSQNLSADCKSPAPVDPAFGGQPSEYDQGNGDYSVARAQAMIKLQVLALSCDLTRFTSYMMGSRSNKRQFPWLSTQDLDVTDGGDGHHGISHDSSAAGLEKQTRIVEDEVKQLAFMLDLMKNNVQGAQTMLYNSIVLFASECGHGEGHDYHNIPIVLAGNAGGKIRSGRHIKYAPDSSYSSMMVSILNLLGVNTNSFGAYKDGPLAQIT
ncbi:MAG: DUF1552 domain-containing protein [Polyangiaceae bacterium]|nr:DUF1552 domain-containing protein [Polyangiaceae bacterium]